MSITYQGPSDACIMQLEFSIFSDQMESHLASIVIFDGFVVCIVKCGISGYVLMCCICILICQYVMILSVHFLSLQSMSQEQKERAEKDKMAALAKRAARLGVPVSALSMNRFHLVS